MKSIVYFTKDLSPKGVKKIFEKLNPTLGNKIAIKLHSGEEGNQNFLGPDFWEELIDSLNGVPLDKDNCVYDMYVSNKPHPNLASDALKAANGVEDLTKEYYAWNMRINLADAYFKTTLTAVAYIKTTNGYVFFNQLSKSVKDLAHDMLEKGSDTYEGSLTYLDNL